MIDQSSPLLVFGGPYSNIEATRALREQAEALAISPDNVICTGDVVAYAADPEATVNLIRDWGITVIAGNCEQQLAEGAADCGCGFEEGSTCDVLSKGWYPYAFSRTTMESRDWMGALPDRVVTTYGGLRFLVIHGGVNQTNRFLFASEQDKLEEEFAAAQKRFGCDVVLAGHAGIPFMRKFSAGAWINAGVIGLPANDGTSRAWYALISARAEGTSIEVRSFDYDHVSAAAAMRRAGHANGYARTLVTGIWPSHDILPERERSDTGRALFETALILPAISDDEPVPA